MYLLTHWYEYMEPDLLSIHETREGADTAAADYVKNSLHKGWFEESDGYTVWRRNGEGLSIVERGLLK